MFFKGRNLLIATKHGKEKVIAPLMERALAVVAKTATDFDTDQLGTFTGEIERTLPPAETARQKCLQAMQLYNVDLCVASEGSFGPHPDMFFVPANEELLFLVDKKNNIEVAAWELSTATNFSSAEISNTDQLSEFAAWALFPTHGLILRAPGAVPLDVEKGITVYKDLERHYKRLLKKYGAVHAETDMRAMYNPSRMLVIEQAAKKLVERLKSECSKCGTPGFGVTAIEPGLPCKLCGLPTRSVLFYLYQCQACAHALKQARPDGKKSEDPTYCDFCNP